MKNKLTTKQIEIWDIWEKFHPARQQLEELAEESVEQESLYLIIDQIDNAIRDLLNIAEGDNDEN